MNGGYTPVIFETHPNGEPIAYDIFSRLMKDRIIWLAGEITDETSDLICSQMVFLSKVDDKAPISLYINSPGGSVYSGLAIYDTMQFVRAPVHTMCVGKAMSMAATLLMSGEPGHRTALPNSRIMLHDLSGYGYGSIHDMQVDMAESNYLHNLLHSITEKHTEMVPEFFKEKMKRDWYLSPKEAVIHGIIDKVITKQKAR